MSPSRKVRPVQLEDMTPEERQLVLAMIDAETRYVEAHATAEACAKLPPPTGDRCHVCLARPGRPHRPGEYDYEASVRRARLWRERAERA